MERSASALASGEGKQLSGRGVVGAVGLDGAGLSPAGDDIGRVGVSRASLDECLHRRTRENEPK